MSDQRAHSRFGGSVINRVIACPGSVALNAQIPAKPPGPYADEGTTAHRLAELCLLKNCHPAAFIDKTLPHAPPISVSLEMSDAVVAYLNVIETERARTKTSIVAVEKGFALDIPTADAGEVFGTNDCLVFHPETGRLRIFDYKHGVGVSVSAEDNAQLKFYAAGAVFSNPEWAVQEIVLTIVQPRARDADEVGHVKDWTFDIVDLLEFLVEVEQAVARAKAFERDKSGRDVFVTGDHCRWCNASHICPARMAEGLAAATVDFADVAEVRADALPAPATMDLERLAKVVAGIDVLQSWANQCREYLEALVMDGHEVPGWKVVEKIGRAKWVEDPQLVAQEAIVMFGADQDQIMPRKLVTITEAEKLLKSLGASKDDIDRFKLKFTLKESSGLTVAQDSDRRPAVRPGADFSSVKPMAAE